MLEFFSSHPSCQTCTRLGAEPVASVTIVKPAPGSHRRQTDRFEHLCGFCRLNRRTPFGQLLRVQSVDGVEDEVCRPHPGQTAKCRFRADEAAVFRKFVYRLTAPTNTEVLAALPAKR